MNKPPETLAFQPVKQNKRWLRIRKGFSDVIWYSVVIILLLAVIMPFVWMLSTSLKGQKEVFSYPPNWIPQQWQWQNYLEVWKDAPFARYFLNSTFVALAVTTGQLASCILAAFAFARMNFKGKNFIFLVFLSTTMISTTVTLVPSYLIMKNFNWIDHYQALIIPFLANAFGVFMIRQSFR